MVRGHDTLAVPDLAGHEAQAGVAFGVHRDHRVDQHAIAMTFADRAEAAAASRPGREFDLAGVLDRKNVPVRRGRTGQLAPAFDDFRRRHLGIGEEPAGALLPGAIAADLTQADCLARDHSFEDRSPPLSRRSSPNDPTDHSMLSPVLRLPRGSESDVRRAGQAVFPVDARPE